MMVHPDACGRGIGRALLEACIARARGRGGTELLTLSVTSGNAAAIHLYESVGFVRYGRLERAVRIGEPLPSQGPDGAAPRTRGLNTMKSLQDIAAEVSGYDPNALPVAQAQQFIARLVPRVETVEMLPLAILARPRAGARPRLAVQRPRARQLGDGRLCAARQRPRARCADAAGARRHRPRRPALRGRRGAARLPAHHDRRPDARRARHRGAAGVRHARGRHRARAARRRARGRQPPPGRRRPGRRQRRARRRARAASGRPRPDRVARRRRGPGVAATARRVLLDGRRAAIDRRAAGDRLRLRQQPLHAVGHAAATQRRTARHGRRARRAGCARSGLSPGRRFGRRGDHLGRRQRR